MKKIQEFEKDSITLFILLMGANVCNYLFQIIMGKLMTVEDYGVTNTLLGMIGILTIPTTIITIICARYIALYASMGNKDKIISVLGLLFRFVVLVGCVLLVAGIVGSESVTELLGLNSRGYILGVLCIAIVNLLFSVTSGTLQGLKMFFPYGIQTILVAAGKLFLSILLITLGWRVYGVLFAIFSGTVISILYGMLHMREHMRDVFHGKTEKAIDIREFCRYALLTIIAQGCVIAITNGDVLLVKIYFSDAETGIYSSAAVIGKIAMYVSTAVVATLFPLVVEKNLNGEDTFPLFKKSLFYGGGISAVCGLGMSILGKYVIGILFGERYYEAIQYLPYVCIFVVPLTFVTILMNYVLAVNKVKRFGISMVLGLVGIIMFSMFIHKEISHLMLISGIILGGVFGINILWLFSERNVNCNN